MTRGRLLAVAFALAGLVVLGWLVHRANAALVWTALQRAAPWLPVLLLLEGGRIAAEAWGARRLYARPIAYSSLIRVTAIGYAVATLAPAGRASAEAAKAVLVSRFTTREDAAAAAATNETASLLVIAAASLLCALVALPVSRALAATFAVQLAVVAAAAALVTAGARTQALAKLVAKLLPRVALVLERVRGHARRQRLRGPLLGFGASRVLQLAGYGVLLLAVTGRAPVASSVLAFGVALVSGSVGDSVPAQLGVSDAGFSAASRPLGLALQDALAVALVAHVVQIVWTAAGLLVPVFTRRRERPPGPAPAPSPAQPPRA